MGDDGEVPPEGCADSKIGFVGGFMDFVAFLLLALGTLFVVVGAVRLRVRKRADCATAGPTFSSRALRARHYRGPQEIQGMVQDEDGKNVIPDSRPSKRVYKQLA